MSEIADLASFGEEEQRDAICLYYRQSGLYCGGSQTAEDLCDEIQRLEIAIWSYAQRGVLVPNGEDRSTIVLEALEFFRDYRQSQLENYQVEAGEL